MQSWYFFLQIQGIVSYFSYFLGEIPIFPYFSANFKVKVCFSYTVLKLFLVAADELSFYKQNMC